MNCEHCNAPAFFQCGDCNSAYYCGKECQTDHYDFHETECIGKGMAKGGKGGKYAKRAGVMKEFRQHKLHSGSKHGPIVKNEKQAWAIAYAESNKKKK